MSTMTARERRAIMKRMELDAVAAAMRAARRKCPPQAPTAAQRKSAAAAALAESEAAEENRRIGRRPIPWPEPEPTFAREFPHFSSDLVRIMRLTAARPTPARPTS